ncbi:uncharacterized protein LOC126549913 isoform X3 [Aphis gossypii]|uniref:uncharacterized protein LOC126549913 isoform X3 n=1 Tax=Aphis gossypii TaxID=80765 RepID=UPI002159918E|nr:uncharacterized protein LOC126549913 isoform X3 [Aphis gossypii]
MDFLGLTIISFTTDKVLDIIDTIMNTTIATTSGRNVTESLLALTLGVVDIIDTADAVVEDGECDANAILEKYVGEIPAAQQLAPRERQEKKEQELIVSMSRSSHDGGDAPEGLSAPTLVAIDIFDTAEAVVEDEPKGKCDAIAILEKDAGVILAAQQLANRERLERKEQALIVSMSRSSHGGGDAPEGLSAPTLVAIDIFDTAEAVVEDEPKGKCDAIAILEKDAGEVLAAQQLANRERKERKEQALIVSMSRSSHGGGDAPEGLSAPTLVAIDIFDTAEAVVEDEPKGKCDAIAILEKDAGVILAAQQLANRERLERKEEELIVSMSRPSHGGGDAPEGLSAPTLVAIDIFDTAEAAVEDEPKGKCDAIAILEKDAGEILAAQQLANRERQERKEQALIVSMSRSSHGGGDAPEGLSAPTLVAIDIFDTAEAVVEDEPKGKCDAIAILEKDAGEILAAQQLANRERQERKEELIVSMSRSSHDGGDALEGLSAPTLVVIDIVDTAEAAVDTVEAVVEDEPKGECDANAFLEKDAGEIPAAQQLAPRKRRRRLAAAWRVIKRFFLCGCCAPRVE